MEQETSSIESPNDVPVVEAEPIKRRVAHVHKKDTRASQRGPISNYDAVLGRQTDEKCYETTYHIKNPGGFKINEKLYKGRVVVPECVANYLCQMDTDWEKTERNLFRNNSAEMSWVRSANVGG